MQSILGLLNHYGYTVLFVALALELIAFPLPGEVLMTYCGFLINEHKMNWLLSIVIASCGAITGITISYFVGGLLGVRFFKRYGHYIHLGPDRLNKTSAWFNKYGNHLLAIAYFIPGVRHITGYFSGITKIAYRKFSINAYIGAFLWTAVFISLGKVLGSKWETYHKIITRYLIIGSITIALVIILIYLYRNFKNQIIEFTIRLLQNSIKTFNLLGRIKLMIVSVVAAFLVFSALVIGLIQDYLAHEFYQFDSLVTLLIGLIFTKEWSYAMNLLSFITSLEVIALLSVLLILWTIFKGTDKFLEVRFMLFTILGGEALQFILRNIFRRPGPTGLTAAVQYTFPSLQSLLAVVVYGFISFMIIRHAEKAWLRTLSVIIALTVCILAGLPALFFQTEYPSDIFAGYVFGGVWLTINIILLEVYRILPKIQT